MLKTEMRMRSQWRADDRATARAVLRTVKTETPLYRRTARRGTAREREVARGALGVLREVRRRERRWKRQRGRHAVLDGLYEGLFPYSERALNSRAVEWVRWVGTRRRGLGYRWFEVLPWLREEYRMGGIERERRRVRRVRKRARRRRDRRLENEIGRWQRRDERMYLYFMREQERDRKEALRQRRREFKRVRAKWGMGKRGRAKAMMRVGWKSFATRVARFTSLSKTKPFALVKKKVVDSVSRLTSLPKTPFTIFKKKAVDSVSRLTSLPKTPFSIVKKKLVDSVSRLKSLPKTPFTIFKKKNAGANDNDAQPRPPVVSGETSEQKPSGSGEAVAPVDSIGARKWRLGKWRNAFGGKKIKGAAETA